MTPSEACAACAHYLARCASAPPQRKTFCGACGAFLGFFPPEVDAVHLELRGVRTRPPQRPPVACPLQARFVARCAGCPPVRPEYPRFPLFPTIVLFAASLLVCSYFFTHCQ